MVTRRRTAAVDATGFFGSIAPATSPMSPRPAKLSMANPYAPEVRPDTRIVPATAVPSDEPRLETHRDNPEISPWSSSGKLDCTTLTDGVSIVPSAEPMNRSPGANAQALGEPFANASSTTTPTSVPTNPADDQGSLRKLLRQSFGRERRDQDARRSPP